MVEKSTYPDGLWRFFFAVAVPLAFGWIPLMPPWSSNFQLELRATYLTVVVGVYLVTNVIPFGITAFIPVFALPFLNIMSAKSSAESFFMEPVAHLLGQFILGGAIVCTDWPRRVALKMLSIAGHRHDRMISLLYWFSFLFAMGASSTIAAMVFCKVVNCIIDERRTTDEEMIAIGDPDMDPDDSPASKDPRPTNTQYSQANANENSNLATKQKSASGNEDGPRLDPSSVQQVPSRAAAKSETQAKASIDDSLYLEFSEDEEEYLSKLSNQYMCTVYTACNIGGLLFPSGTLPAYFAYRSSDLRKRKFLIDPKGTMAYFAVSFSTGKPAEELHLGTWISYVAPIVIVLGVLAYIYCLVWNTCMFPIDPSHRKIGSMDGLTKTEKRFYGARYEEQDSSLAHQMTVLVFLIICIILQITRDPRIFKGWSHLLWEAPLDKKTKKIKTVIIEDSAVVFLIVFFMCTIPRLTDGFLSKESSLPVLEWNKAGQKIMWSVVIVHGGQGTLTEGLHISGLTKHVVHWMGRFAKSSHVQLSWIVIVSAKIFSEMLGGLAASNFFTTAVTFVSQYNKNKYGITALPAAVISCLSFMFPVATSANAICYNTAKYNLRIFHMMAFGFFLDVMAVVVVGCLHMIRVTE